MTGLSRKRARLYIQIGVAVCLVAVVAAVFIRNNRDIFGIWTGGPARPENHIASSRESAPDKAAAGLPAAADTLPDTRQLSVDLLDMPCRLKGDDVTDVVVSVRLLFAGEGLRQEVLLKREDLKVIVRKVLASTALSEIVVESLRARMRDELNAVLDSGEIRDLEFLKFQPVM
jgi:flagellar basal body-associated protein FliL